jgi:hypothetical protein
MQTRFVFRKAACLVVLGAVVLLTSAPGLLPVFGAQPGQSQPMLADRHKDAGVDCQACHGQSPPTGAAPVVACAGCHGDIAKVAERTQSLHPNPHESHEGEMPCDECHHAHKLSVDYCAKCHQFGFQVP